MHKWWSLLFGVIMALAVLSFVVAPIFGWWLPRNVSTFGPQVDGLFYMILGITGFFFILTEALLVYFLYTYGQGGPGAQQEHVVGHHYSEQRVLWTSFFKRIARPITAVIHDQHRLELTWTFIPGVVLLFIAFVQIGTWENIKYQSHMPSANQNPLHIEVSARQFEWRLRYASPERMMALRGDPNQNRDFDKGEQADDIHVVNEVHTWKDQPVLVHLRTRDVIHSFYLPNLRLKQDALPGKTIPVWFKATDFNTTRDGDHWVDGGGIDPKTGEPKDRTLVWELACAELCGWGHYKMVGRLYVHETEADFLDWLRHAQQAQNLSQVPAASNTAAR